MLAVTSMALPLSAMAQQSQTVVPPTATATAIGMDNVIVPMRDVRGADLYSVQGTAGVLTVGHIVIIYGRSDPNALEVVKDSARNAISNGLPVRGIMVSDAYNNEMIEIWAGSDRFAAEVAPFDNLGNKIDNILVDAADYAARDLEIRENEKMAQAPATPVTGLN